MVSTRQTALVTGANRGIGLEFVKQLKKRGYYTIGCCRQPMNAGGLKKVADDVFRLDITQDEQIMDLKTHLKGKPIDLLVNNAGITGDAGVTAGNVYRDNYLHVLDVNCVGTLLLSDALLSNIITSQDKYIVVISSSMGSIAENDRGRSYAYRTSKAALNCVMRSFAIDTQSKGVKVMLLHPGWVKTEIGGDNALIDAESSVNGMLEQIDTYIATSHAETLRRYDGGTIPW